MKTLTEEITINRVNNLHPLLRDEVFSIIDTIRSKGVEIRVVQGLRTFAEQDALYAQGRVDKTKPIVTNAKGGQSYHNFGLALDFALIHKDGKVSWDLREDFDNDKISDWSEVVHEFELKGWSWGGLWKQKDNPHFEKTFGFNFRQLSLLPKDEHGYPIIKPRT